MNFCLFWRHAQALEDQGNSKVISDSKKKVPVLDKEKNIAFLLKELDSLRDLSKKVNLHVKSMKSVILGLLYLNQVRLELNTDENEAVRDRLKVFYWIM